MTTIVGYKADLDCIELDVFSVLVDDPARAQMFDEGTRSVVAFSKMTPPSARWGDVHPPSESTMIDRIPEHGENHYRASLSQESLQMTRIRDKGECIGTDAACDTAQDSVKFDPMPEQETSQQCVSFSQGNVKLSLIANKGEPIKSDDCRKKGDELKKIDPCPGQESKQHCVPFINANIILDKDQPIETEVAPCWTVVASSSSLLKNRSKFDVKPLSSVTRAGDSAPCRNGVQALLMYADTKRTPQGQHKESMLRKISVVHRPPVPQKPKPLGLPRRKFFKAEQRHVCAGRDS